MPDAEWFPIGDARYDGLVREVRDQDECAIDTETTGLSIWADRPLYYSMAWGGNRRVCMPIETLHYFKESFEDSTKRWILCNAKFDMHMLANKGVELAGDCIDISVMHSLLFEEESHALKDMAKSVLGWRWTDFFDTFSLLNLEDSTKPLEFTKGGKPKKQTRKENLAEMFARVERDNLSLLVDYASNDAYGTLRLYEALKKLLGDTPILSLYPNWLPTMEHLFFMTEVPFTKVLWQCERNGVYVDRPYLQKLRGPMWDEVEQLRRREVQITGDPNFNSNSVQQLRDYFFKHLGLQPLMMTKGGKSGVKSPSVDKGFLEHYEHEVELAAIVLRKRKLEKLIGTYIDGADEFFDTNSRIHTRFNQDVARTGRLSSSGPNLQNIPKPETDKFQIRGAFQATPGAGTGLLVNDYAALEMRLLAAATVTAESPEGAKEMIQIFLDGKDIHMGNAAMVYGPIFERQYGWRLTYDFLKEAKKIDGQVKDGKLPAEKRTERHEQALIARGAIKAVGFGLNYGMKEAKLARSLNISVEEAQAIIEAYLNTYPAVKQFYNDAIEETRLTGYSFTLLGRRRCHPQIHSPRERDRWSEERKAVNNQIQGTAADAVRMAMINIYNARLDRKYGCKMLLQVHDELMFECPMETIKEAQAEIGGLMRHPFPTDLIVPLDISSGIGPAWNKAK